MESRQLEAIKLKIAEIKSEINAEDKKELVANGICSMGTIDTYVTKGDAKNFTLANKIYKFLNKRVKYRFKELNK